VDDVRPFVRSAACYVVPLRVGGGTRLKVVDAWAMGKAVVTTSQGCEGLAAEHDVNSLIADTPEAFAAAIAAVLEHPERAAALGRAARALVERTYAWDALGVQLLDAYRGLVQGAPRQERDAVHHRR
jgi:glycosyltransferase involved in cell wall biosynthesis